MVTVNGEIVKSIKSTGQVIHSLYISNDGRFVISASCSSIQMYHSLSLEVVNFISLDPLAHIVSIAVAPDEVLYLLCITHYLCCNNSHKSTPFYILM